MGVERAHGQRTRDRRPPSAWGKTRTRWYVCGELSPFKSVAESFCLAASTRTETTPAYACASSSKHNIHIVSYPVQQGRAEHKADLECVQTRGEL